MHNKTQVIANFQALQHDINVFLQRSIANTLNFNQLQDYFREIFHEPRKNHDLFLEKIQLELETWYEIQKNIKNFQENGSRFLDWHEKANASDWLDKNQDALLKLEDKITCLEIIHTLTAKIDLLLDPDLNHFNKLFSNHNTSNSLQFYVAIETEIKALINAQEKIKVIRKRKSPFLGNRIPADLLLAMHNQLQSFNNQIIYYQALSCLYGNESCVNRISHACYEEIMEAEFSGKEPFYIVGSKKDIPKAFQLLQQLKGIKIADEKRLEMDKKFLAQPVCDIKKIYTECLEHLKNQMSQLEKRIQKTTPGFRFMYHENQGDRGHGFNVRQTDYCQVIINAVPKPFKKGEMHDHVNFYYTDLAQKALELETEYNATRQVLHILGEDGENAEILKDFKRIMNSSVGTTLKNSERCEPYYSKAEIAIAVIAAFITVIPFILLCATGFSIFDAPSPTVRPQQREKAMDILDKVENCLEL